MLVWTSLQMNWIRITTFLLPRRYLCAPEALFQPLQPHTRSIRTGIRDLTPVLAHPVTNIRRAPKLRLHRRSILRLLLRNLNTLPQIIRLRQRLDKRDENIHDRPIALPCTGVVLQVVQRG